MMTAVGFALGIPLFVLLGQDRAPSIASPSAYRVGPGDVLEVTVAGRPELSRLPTVQTTGVIWLPQLSEVRVEGLTPVEIGRKLTELLARRDDPGPMVTVAVREYRSQFVWVRGEVNRPGREPPVRRLRAGTHVTLQVASTRAGEVLLRGLGLVQPVEPGTPASFDVLLTAPGRYDAVLDPVAGRPVRVGRLVVSGCCRRP